jgi:hypothetical protein
VALLILADVSGHTHELVHHVVARFTCGRWGEITFWLYKGPQCEPGWRQLVPIFAGPSWTYLLAWIGALYIVRGQLAWGLALVFAQLTWARLAVSMVMNDESALRRQLLPAVSGWIVEAALLSAVAIPPLVIAVRALWRAGAAPLLWRYLVLGLLGWMTFIGWDRLTQALPLGMSFGFSRWYFVVVPGELVWLFAWRGHLSALPLRRRGTVMPVPSAGHDAAL